MEHGTEAGTAEPTLEEGTMSVAEHNLTDRITYTDLYRRWEQNNWSAMDLDFSKDKDGWEALSDIQRKSALWIYSMFFFGEDSVADNLSPYIDAAPKEEQKYFLATQQVDEARHAVFFHRFFSEVIGAGDDIASTLAFTEKHLGWGYTAGLQPPRQDGRRAAARPVAAEVRPGDHALPPDRRGEHGPARSALHRGLLRPRGLDARLQRRHGERLPRRAAPHRLRRQGAERAAAGIGRVQGGGRRAARRGLPLALVGVHSRRTGTANTPAATGSSSRRSPRGGSRRSR